MEYKFNDIEKKWQALWEEKGVYRVVYNAAKPKCYVLDMFPYPSGVGLHVGHPLGFIASDIYSRYKRLKGFNVLHPMGYDAFGLPAEQYAIEHGIHPAVSTAANIGNFRKQMDKIGFCFDWDREVNTSKPPYYKWTQWIFLQLFDSFFNRQNKKAEKIDCLVQAFEKEGNASHPIPSFASLRMTNSFSSFTAAEWSGFDEKQKADILMEYRLAYCGYGEVNWCEALGTVLANDEVVNGVSERGGYPVVKKKLRQWYLRITEYADRLLEGLQTVEFSEAMKEMQGNWIGKSEGAEIEFGMTTGLTPEAPPQPFSLTPNPSPGGEGNHFFKTANKKNWDVLKDLARENRKKNTETENALWQELRNNQLGYKVRRQHVIDGFIIDFAFLEKMLLIEIDGGYHQEKEQKEYDEARTKYLEELGYKILRFTNEQVTGDKNVSLNKIRKELQTPLSVRRGAGGEAEKTSADLEGATSLTVYTTRPDTIFGVDFMVIAPEHDLVEKITTPGQQSAVDEYIAYVKSRSERERMAEKKISGVFTGAYAIRPFDGKLIPVWISEYVLAGYGTGAIMGVPCGDERDHKFANHFNIPITNIIGQYYNGEEANPTKEATLENSDFLNGRIMKDAIGVVINKVQEMGIGKRKVNYKMRDAAFSRQRYWGEPFPVKWINGIAYPLDESELPLELPKVENYKPGPEGEGPLANIPSWTARNLETNTMPGYAGSSWYFLRYMDPHNDQTFCDRKISDYWGQVDLYIGGTEHAVGHLLYSRMWTKFLFDRGLIGFDEPFKKLLNQGMITGSSRFVYRFSYVLFQGFKKSKDSHNAFLYPLFLSKTIADKYHTGDETTKQQVKNAMLEILQKANPARETLPPYEATINPLHVDVNIVDGLELDIDAFRKWRNGEYADAILVCEDGSINSPLSARRGAGGEAEDASKVSPSGATEGNEGWERSSLEGAIYICGIETEKMSKSKFNTVNPDDIVSKYGADTFRMYEMFLGPVEMSKPWDTKGIEGVSRFLKKFWRLFMDEEKGLIVTADPATEAELKVLHKAIKKIEEDTERFSFNTAVSAFMIATNELTDLKCHKKEILEPLLIILAPYAPHITEELYFQLKGGSSTSLLDAAYPVFQEKYVLETSKSYPVAINGKTRTELTIDLNASQQEVEQLVLANETVKKWLEGKAPKKIIYVKGKMINVVI